MRSAAAGRAEGPPPSGCAESSTAPRGAPRSSTRLGSGCSPTSDSPPPSARPSAGSRGGRSAGRLAERTSISAQSAGDATAAACPASRSWRSPGGLPGPPGTHGRPAGGDRRQSGAAAGSQAGASGAGFPRSGRRSPQAPGDPASRSTRPAPSAASRGRARGRPYITGTSAQTSAESWNITGCHCRHCRRAAATSGRRCSAACTVFFEGKPQALDRSPQGGERRGGR